MYKLKGLIEDGIEFINPSIIDAYNVIGMRMYEILSSVATPATKTLERFL